MVKFKKNIIKILICISVISLFYCQIVFGQDNENKKKKSGIPEWLKVYMDVGYVYGGKNKLKSRINYEEPVDVEYYYDHYDNLEIEGRKSANLSFGALMFPNIKRVPIYLNFGILNLYEGLKDDYYSDINDYILHWGGDYEEFSYNYNKNESNPQFLFGLGYYKIYYSLLMNISFSYLGSLKGENIYRNYSFSTSLSKNYKNLSVILGGDYSIYNSNIFYETYLYEIGYYDRTIKINSKNIGMEFNISYRFKFINPYISIYRTFYSNPEINYLSNINNSSLNAQIGNSEEYKYMIIKTGIYISYSNISSYIKNTCKDFSLKSKIRNYFMLGFSE